MKTTISHNIPYKEWEVIHDEKDHYSMVYPVESDTENSTTISLKELHLSKYWPIRKLQLWAVKKSFK